MRTGTPFLTIALGLAACVSSTESDRERDTGAEAECAASRGTATCVEGTASAQAHPTSSSEADVASPGASPSAGAAVAPASAREASASLAADAGAQAAREAGSQSDAGAAGPGGEGGCEYLSQLFEEGAVFPANDGCNSCQCFRGSAGCTLIGCGQRPKHCDLPFEPGSCGESHLYYAHNPSTGLCEAKQYTGCGGNLNRFEEYAGCAYRCSLRDGAGKNCTYDGRSYRHRERVARKPSEMTGCGPCLCNDGRVLCPPEDCRCPEGHKLGLQCVGCTSAGGCSDLEERCFPACATDADCDTKYAIFCDKGQGVCISTPACIRDGGS